MDPTIKIKAIGAGALLLCIEALALTGKVSGDQALQAIEAIGGVFLGGAAILGTATAISNAIKRAPEAKDPQ